MTNRTIQISFCYMSLMFSFISGCSAKSSLQRSATEISLLPCPALANCVSSMEEDGYYSILPIIYQGTRAEALATMTVIVAEMENTTLRQQAVDYLHFEFRSKFIGFVDDVEFFFPENELTIHVRSASRSGISDFGVNRRRVEEIRLLFAEYSANITQ